MPQLDPLETRMLLNITGIITFDSPLFGLNNSLVYLLVPKSVEVAKLAPQYIPKSLDEVIPDRVNVPIIKDFSVGVSTSW
jgi:hypothetical protein